MESASRKLHVITLEITFRQTPTLLREVEEGSWQWQDSFDLLWGQES